MDTAGKLYDLVSKSLRSRLMICCSLCSAAQSEIRDGHLERSIQTIKSARRIIGEVHLLIDAPGCISVSELRESEELLAEVMERIAQAEVAIARVLASDNGLTSG